MSCTINAMAATLRQVSRYLDEISFLPELEHPFSTQTDTDASGVTRVTVYLAANSSRESEAIERLCHLAGELGGKFHLGGPIRESDGGTFRALEVSAPIPTGGTLRIWSPVAYTAPVPAEPVGLPA